MGLERTALPTSWGRIGPECVNLTVPSETSRRVGLEFVCIFGQAAGPGRPWVPAYGLEKTSYESLVLSWALFS